MAANKNAWSHILDTNPIGAEGPPVKVNMQCTFEDTYEKFCGWVEAEFKNPGALPLSVVIGERKAQPSSPNIYCTFEGSAYQFINFMQETFKNPNGLRISAVVGNETPKTAAKERLEEMSDIPAPLLKLILDKRLEPNDARRVHRTYDKEGNKIGAIKMLREFTGFGLKEAKDVVEAIQREIPF